MEGNGAAQQLRAGPVAEVACGQRYWATRGRRELGQASTGLRPGCLLDCAGKERAAELLLGCLAGLCGAGAGAGRTETERESWTEGERGRGGPSGQIAKRGNFPFFPKPISNLS